MGNHYYDTPTAEPPTPKIVPPNRRRVLRPAFAAPCQADRRQAERRPEVLMKRQHRPPAVFAAHRGAEALGTGPGRAAH